jgi:hypothetical protein
MSVFHSINETKKPVEERVHHNNNNCPSGREIPKNKGVYNAGGYRVCFHCQNLNR